MKNVIQPKGGLEAIEKHQPDLVFLDIEMPVMNGFELLEQFKQIHFSVVFTTSYDQYAIKAIRFSALDYLLKPIDPKELITNRNVPGRFYCNKIKRYVVVFIGKYKILGHRVKGDDAVKFYAREFVLY